MDASERPLAGKTAVVTGGSRGLGRAIGMELAQRGANVALNFFRHAEEATGAVADLEAAGVRALAVRADVRKRDQVQRFFTKVDETFGGVDVVVCNAASGVFRPLLEIDEEAWDWTMETSVQGALWCVQAAVPLLEKKGGGRIVNVGSLGVTRVLPDYGMNAVAKGGLDALTRYLAVELAPRKIVVNAVIPGIVDTAAWKTYLSTTKRQLHDASVARTPDRQGTTPEEVARVVAFLAGPDAGGIVGQALLVDHGFSLPW
jgi:enoyl-[acyl-carrier protein] reductase III